VMIGYVMSHIQGDVPPAGRLTAPPLPRLAAVAVDGATYLIIPALLIPVGLLLTRRGVTLSSPAVNAIGFVLVIAPATAWAAWWEVRPRGCTPGKRLLRLQVIDQRTRALPSPKQAVVRNLIKIALPWELGHTVALGYAYTEGSVVPSWSWTLTAVTYGWLLLTLILLIISSHRPVHDRLARTVVRVPRMVVTP
jgi:uncharacterized RDD family membrane protein YckC